jgi:predicted RNA methylase
MATDYQRIIRNLQEFVDFTGRAVIAVGAGGGQLVEYGRGTAKTVAVDRDPAALDVLRKRAAQAGLADKFVLVRADFMEFRERGDIVLFEFCLHEIPDPGAALAQALTLAPAVVVMDHWPGSEWAFMASEEDKAAAAWAAIRASRPEKIVSFDAVQVFKDYEELRLKLQGQGQTSLDRIARFMGRTDITIPMSYGFALIK